MLGRDKVQNLLKLVSGCIEAGRYLDTRHSSDRKNERLITRPEVLYILKNGYHEKKKDHFEDQYQAWNYAVRGKTIDRRELRIIVSFDLSGMLIITAIDLDR